MEEFIVNFKDLFEDADSIAIQPNTKFRELEDWDSIMGLSVIGMIDDEYSVTFNAEDMKACNTVEDLYTRVLSKK